LKNKKRPGLGSLGEKGFCRLALSSQLHDFLQKISNAWGFIRLEENVN